MTRRATKPFTGSYAIGAPLVAASLTPRPAPRYALTVAPKSNCPYPYDNDPTAEGFLPYGPEAPVTTTPSTCRPLPGWSTRNDPQLGPEPRRKRPVPDFLVYTVFTRQGRCHVDTFRIPPGMDIYAVRERLPAKVGKMALVQAYTPAEAKERARTRDVDCPPKLGASRRRRRHR